MEVIEFELRAAWDEIRTLWINEDKELHEVIDGIHQLEEKFSVRRENEKKLPHRRRRTA